MNLLQFYTLSSLNLDVARNISKAFLDPTIILLKYAGKHVPYLPHPAKWTAAFQYGATCAWKPVALLTGAAGTRSTEISAGRSSANTQNITASLQQSPKTPVQGYLCTARVLRHQKMVIFYNKKMHFGRKVWGEVCEDVQGELAKMRSDKRDYDTFRRASLWIEQIGQRMSCCSASSCMKNCFPRDNRVKNIKHGSSIKYRRNIKYRPYPDRKEWWSLGSYEAKVFCRILIAFCTYCCVFRVEKKPQTQPNKHCLRLGWDSGNLSSASFLAFVWHLWSYVYHCEQRPSLLPLLSPLLLTWHLKLLKL